MPASAAETSAGTPGETRTAAFMPPVSTTSTPTASVPCTPPYFTFMPTAVPPLTFALASATIPQAVPVALLLPCPYTPTDWLAADKVLTMPTMDDSNAVTLSATLSVMRKPELTYPGVPPVYPAIPGQRPARNIGCLADRTRTAQQV